MLCNESSGGGVSVGALLFDFLLDLPLRQLTLVWLWLNLLQKTIKTVSKTDVQAYVKQGDSLYEIQLYEFNLALQKLFLSCYVPLLGHF